MENKKPYALLIVCALCCLFFFSVLGASVANVPDLLINADRPSATVTTDASFGKVNINTGLREELLTLPGVGEVIAERIIAYLEENGPFSSIEELVNVKGIGEKTLEKLKDLITV